MSGSSSLRKVKKPLIERKRRERINESLDQLKRLVLEAKQTNESNFCQKCSKMGKADILEMTVTHLRVLNLRFHSLSRSPLPSLSPPPSTPPPRHQPLCNHQNSVSFSPLNQTESIMDYEDGFTSCLTEVQRYLSSSSSNPRLQLRSPTESDLVKHLRRSLVEHVQNTRNYCAQEGHRKTPICEQFSSGNSTQGLDRRNPTESENLRRKWTSPENDQSSPVFHLSMTSTSSSETSFSSSTKDTSSLEETFRHCIESTRFIPFNSSSPLTASDVELLKNEEDSGRTSGVREMNQSEMAPGSKMMSGVTVTVPPDVVSSHLLTEERNPLSLPITNSGSADIDGCSFQSCSGSHPRRHSSTQKRPNETHPKLVWRPW